MHTTYLLPVIVAMFMVNILAVNGDASVRKSSYIMNSNPPGVGLPLENFTLSITSVVTMQDCARECSSLPLCWWYVTYDYSPVTQTYVCMTSSLPPTMAVVPTGGQMMTGEKLLCNYIEQIYGFCD